MSFSRPLLWNSLSVRPRVGRLRPFLRFNRYRALSKRYSEQARAADLQVAVKAAGRGVLSLMAFTKA